MVNYLNFKELDVSLDKGISAECLENTSNIQSEDEKWLYL